VIFQNNRGQNRPFFPPQAPQPKNFFTTPGFLSPQTFPPPNGPKKMGGKPPGFFGKRKKKLPPFYEKKKRGRGPKNVFFFFFKALRGFLGKKKGEFPVKKEAQGRFGALAPPKPFPGGFFLGGILGKSWGPPPPLSRRGFFPPKNLKKPFLFPQISRGGGLSNVYPPKTKVPLPPKAIPPEKPPSPLGVKKFFPAPRAIQKTRKKIVGGWGGFFFPQKSPRDFPPPPPKGFFCPPPSNSRKNLAQPLRAPNLSLFKKKKNFPSGPPPPPRPRPVAGVVPQKNSAKKKKVGGGVPGWGPVLPILGPDLKKTRFWGPGAPQKSPRPKNSKVPLFPRGGAPRKNARGFQTPLGWLFGTKLPDFFRKKKKNAEFFFHGKKGAFFFCRKKKKRAPLFGYKVGDFPGPTKKGPPRLGGFWGGEKKNFFPQGKKNFRWIQNGKAPRGGQKRPFFWGGPIPPPKTPTARGPFGPPPAFWELFKSQPLFPFRPLGGPLLEKTPEKRKKPPNQKAPKSPGVFWGLSPKNPA